MRLVDIDELSRKMYHDAFETDTDLQKWESGCWIRYKMFENAVNNAPVIDAMPISVIDDIKSEIEQHCCITVGSDNEPAMTLYDIFKILDKHISGKESE